jgi:hypothetical protein
VTETTFRTIGELADRCGHYCWVEHRLFELAGAWAGEEGEPAVRVFLAALSRLHGLLANEWYDRLPVRAGIDPSALVVPPPGPLEGVFAALGAEPDLRARLAGLTGVVLPQLLAAYNGHLAQASPVAEGPVMAVLRHARLVAATDLESDWVTAGIHQ